MRHRLVYNLGEIVYIECEDCGVAVSSENEARAEELFWSHINPDDFVTYRYVVDE